MHSENRFNSVKCFLLSLFYDQRNQTAVTRLLHTTTTYIDTVTIKCSAVRVEDLKAFISKTKRTFFVLQYYLERKSSSRLQEDPSTSSKSQNRKKMSVFGAFQYLEHFLKKNCSSSKAVMPLKRWFFTCTGKF